MVATDALYLTDAYLRRFPATVVSRDGDAVVLDRTAFYPTGGGQPHDIGTIIAIAPDGSDVALDVTDVRKDGDAIVHTIDPDSGHNPSTLAPFEGAADLLVPGAEVTGEINWERRHQLMRTHSALHILCGVIWNEWSVPVTGGNMEPLEARMDFEFDPLPDGFAERITELVNDEIAADRPIEVSFLDRGEALEDADLIRTKVNMIPESVSTIRVVDIVGLDKQADGGTHVASTAEVGRFEVTKTESKGKGNKRVRIALSDPA